MLLDAYNRQIKDLRISLTDRCNFRCFYCRPVCETLFAGKESVLTFEEILYISDIFVSLGIEKIRLTGGEPLLRRGVENLIEKLARLKILRSEFQISNESQITNYKLQNKTQPEIQSKNQHKIQNKNQSEICNLKSEINNSPRKKNADRFLKDLAITTNGFSLGHRAEKLKRAGLDRVTISLDSLERNNFRKITGADKLEEVLEGIEAAQAAGLSPVKINAVIIRGWNENEIVALAGFARKTGVSMRFIEFMPLDSGSAWRREQIVSGKEIYEKINARFPLKPQQISRGSETARRYVFADGAAGEIGIIAPVTEMFCGACSRIRLTADGQIRTCLFSANEYNLRDFIRSGASRYETAEFIRAAVLKKELRHRINDSHFIPSSRSMSFIGG